MKKELKDNIKGIKEASQSVENCIEAIIDHCKKELTEDETKYLHVALKGIRATILNLQNALPNEDNKEK